MRPRSAIRALYVLIIGAALAGALNSASASSARRILFYEPDANHHALIQVTKWFNLYLKAANPRYTFQPVQSISDFEKELKSRDVAFVIVSSEYLKQSKRDLQPLLVQANDQDVYYRKVLVAKEGSTAASLQGKHIAAAISSSDRKAATDKLLTELKTSSASVSPGMVVPVAKDIDALFALTFGHVQGALVTPSSIEVLKRVSPAAAAGVRTIYESPPILRAPFAAVDSRVGAKEKEQIISVLQGMLQDENGRRVMHGLAFNNWRPYEESMLGEVVTP